MIILNTVNHENNKIEYHFSHDDHKGQVFKILSSFDMAEDNGEHYLTCDYEQLDHKLNVEISEDEIKKVCDEFSMASLQSLLKALEVKVEAGLGEEQDGK